MRGSVGVSVNQAPRLRLPRPHRGQQLVRLQAKRFNAISGGRRWRKTTHCLSIAVEEAQAGNAIIWGAPVYDQVRIGFLEAEKAVRGVCRTNITHMEIIFPANEGRTGRILFRSLDDPDNVKGHTADGVVIDEVGDVNKTAWYEALRPMLMDTNGWAWLIGTPRPNWFRDEFNSFGEMPDGMAWQIPTLGCAIEDGVLVRKPHPLENPEIKWTEIQHLYNSMPESTFRQEVLAEFLDHEGAVFRNIKPCLLHESIGAPGLHETHGKVMGVDWGQRHDFTVISIVCQHCSTEVELARYNKADWEFLRSQVTRLAKKWGARDILVELNSIGSPNFEILRQEGLPVRPFLMTASSKPPLIQQLRLAFEQERMMWLNQEWATRELEAYTSRINQVTSRVTYGPNGEAHDDSVVARSLACWAISTPTVIHFS